MDKHYNGDISNKERDATEYSELKNDETNHIIIVLINTLREFVRTHGSVSISDVYAKWNEFVQCSPYFSFLLHLKIDVISFLLNYPDIKIMDGMCVSTNNPQVYPIFESDKITDSFFDKLINTDEGWDTGKDVHNFLQICGVRPMSKNSTYEFENKQNKFDIYNFPEVPFGCSEANKSGNFLCNNEQKSQDLVESTANNMMSNTRNTVTDITNEKSVGSFETSDVFDTSCSVPQTAVSTQNNNNNNKTQTQRINRFTNYVEEDDYANIYNEITVESTLRNLLGSSVSQSETDMNCNVVTVTEGTQTTNVFPSSSTYFAKQRVADNTLIQSDGRKIDISPVDQITTVNELQRQNYLFNEKLTNITLLINKINESIEKIIQKEKIEHTKIEDISKYLSHVNASIKKLEDTVEENIKEVRNQVTKDYEQTNATLLSELKTCQKQLNLCTNELEQNRKAYFNLKKQLLQIQTENQFEWNKVMSTRDKDQYQIVLEVTNKINQFRRILGCDPCADKKYWEEIMEMSHNIYINNEKSYCKLKTFLESTDGQSIENVNNNLSCLKLPNDHSNRKLVEFVQNILVEFQFDLVKKCQELSSVNTPSESDSQHSQDAIAMPTPGSKAQSDLMSVDSAQNSNDYTNISDDVELHDTIKEKEPRKITHAHEITLNNHKKTTVKVIDRVIKSLENVILSDDGEKINEQSKEATVNINKKDTMTNESSAYKICQLDKLMCYARNKYTGIMDLDLLDSLMEVRKMHNNSLNGIDIKTFIEEMDKKILKRYKRYTTAMSNNAEDL